MKSLGFCHPVPIALGMKAISDGNWLLASIGIKDSGMAPSSACDTNVMDFFFLFAFRGHFSSL